MNGSVMKYEILEKGMMSLIRMLFKANEKKMRLLRKISFIKQRLGERVGSESYKENGSLFHSRKSWKYFRKKMMCFYLVKVLKEELMCLYRVKTFYDEG